MADSSELFEAISHPTRIRILKILEDHPTSFAALKRELSIDSSGNLDHHLKKLSGLVLVQRDGLYALTDDGKEALTSVRTIEIWKDVEDRRSKALADAPRSFHTDYPRICGRSHRDIQHRLAHIIMAELGYQFLRLLDCLLLRHHHDDSVTTWSAQG